jgi:hypothetical protein
MHKPQVESVKHIPGIDQLSLYLFSGHTHVEQDTQMVISFVLRLVISTSKSEASVGFSRL